MIRIQETRGRLWAVCVAGLLAAGCSDLPTGPLADGGERHPARPAPDVVDPPFRISVRYVAPAAAEDAAALERAVQRWQTIIVSDLPDQALRAPADACFEGQPEVDETVDDLILYVQIGEIDGPGNYAGEAGPCYLRAGSLLPLMGYIKLDAVDLQYVREAGYLDDLLLHELGHVLGVGTLWQAKSMVQGVGGDDPRVLGMYTSAAYRALGGLDSSVPVENTGSFMTRDVHWRESVFTSELMTSYINTGGNPLSALTIASLQDLGYGVNTATAASSYALRGAAPVRGGFDAHRGERVVLPRYTVDRYGRPDVLPR